MLGMKADNLPSEKKRKPTLRDIAELTGVTIATVSRILNNKGNFRASSEVRANVITAAKSLGYLSEMSAQYLNAPPSQLIGILCGSDANTLSNLDAAVLEGIAGILMGAGYQPMIILGEAKETSNRIPSLRIKGALLLSPQADEVLAELDQRRIPYISLTEQCGQAIARVLPDEKEAIKRLLSYLTSLGHNRLAFASTCQSSVSDVIQEGRYQQIASVARELDLEASSLHEANSPRASKHLMKLLRSGERTAVIACDHHAAFDVLAAAYNDGLRIPHDFSLACCTDQYPVCVGPPSITAIHLPGREIGRVAASLLVEHLSGNGKTTTDAIVQVSAELITRSSTARPKTLVISAEDMPKRSHSSIMP